MNASLLPAIVAGLGCVAACGSSAPPQSLVADASTGDAELADLGSSQDLEAANPSDLAAVVDLAPGSQADLSYPLAFVEDPIAYGPTRQGEMADYSLAHYGVRTAQLTPKLIVLHFTDTATYSSAWNTFAADTPNRGELPGTCSHFIVEQDGTIAHLVDLGLRCRHAVGLNHVAIGVEMIQDSMGLGGAWGDAQILARPAQIDAALHLVKWLQAKYGLADTDVIGHAMANDSPLFVDLEGWTNDHVDWQAADVAAFRARLAGL